MYEDYSEVERHGGTMHGGLFISADEIEWMEEFDKQEREDDLKRRAIDSARRDMLAPTAYALNGKKIFRNIYTGDLCFADGSEVK
ncbi:MAG: hypothetical protein M0R48_09895 [Candidatus Omnitrophica bacterium]|nr:hypothetical protein [Candidatus Omnitrophota bacterium]